MQLLKKLKNIKTNEFHPFINFRNHTLKQRL